MPEVQVYALKGDADWAETISNSLKAGVGRFGWSYMKADDGTPLGDADLRRLKTKIDAQGWGSFTIDEQARYQAFLLELRRGDYVIYVNVPEWGRCTVAQVKAPYYWECNGAADSDFNHRFRVDPATIYEFDRNDASVAPALSARLKLQGRYWRIYATEEFNALLASLKAGVSPQPRTAQSNASLLSREIEPLLKDITKKVQRTSPNYDLEALLELLFAKVPGVRKVTRQGGAGDHGADLIVEFEGGLPHPVFQTQHVCVVQVKSYVGEHWDTRAVDDIGRAFVRYPNADMGLIISTADSSTKALDDAIARLRNSSGKRVEILIGADVARFLLRFGGEVLE
jgi:hypothetical protein